MKFNNHNLSVIAYANGFTLWHYSDTTIKYSEFDYNNFFARIWNLCGVGDKFMVNLNKCYLELVIVSVDTNSVKLKEIQKVEFDDETCEDK